MARWIKLPHSQQRTMSQSDIRPMIEFDDSGEAYLEESMSDWKGTYPRKFAMTC